MQQTAKNTFMISSIDAAKILGVNVATVKRWTDMGKLDCVKTAGGHRKFLLRHLAAFAMEHDKYAHRISLLPLENRDDLEVSDQILRADFNELTPRLLELSLKCDQKSVNKILNSLYLLRQDLTSIYEDLITPVLHAVGEMWHAGELSISQEHLASQTIRDAIIELQNVVVKPANTKGKAFVLTLSDELHDISAKMVQHLLEIKGFQVLYSGQKTPPEDGIHVFESFQPDRVYLSSSFIGDLSRSQEEIELLVQLCKRYNAGLYVGGEGIKLLELKENKQVHILETLRAVANS